MNRYKKLFLTVISLAMLLLAACGGTEGNKENGKQNAGKKEKIVFADAGWDSIRVHNWVARTIIEEGYGYPTGKIPGTNSATFLGLREGEIDVYMEVWTRSLGEAYHKALKSGKIEKVSENFVAKRQGLFVPTYVIEGDPERGIEPMAPDLKSVKDLPKYWELFKDPADPEKGRIVGSPSGWNADKIIQQKMKVYGLNDTYNYFRPGSGAALASSLASAYKAGEPWVGYYWGPTWVLGKFDMTLLQEPPFDPEIWKKNKACAYPKVPVDIAINKKLSETAPEIVEFLKNYKTSAKLTNEALAYLQEQDAKAKEAATWFLREHTDLWTKWVPDDVAQKVKDAIQKQ